MAYIVGDRTKAWLLLKSLMSTSTYDVCIRQDYLPVFNMEAVFAGDLPPRVCRAVPVFFSTCTDLLS